VERKAVSDGVRFRLESAATPSSPRACQARSCEAFSPALLLLREPIVGSRQQRGAWCNGKDTTVASFDGCFTWNTDQEKPSAFVRNWYIDAGRRFHVEHT
jgi:hypothetical protein